MVPGKSRESCILEAADCQIHLMSLLASFLLVSEASVSSGSRQKFVAEVLPQNLLFGWGVELHVLFLLIFIRS
jgi:hypothetical protein